MSISTGPTSAPGNGPVWDRLDEIRDRADNATEGPWRSREVDDFHDEMPDAIEVLGPGPSTVTMVSTRDWDSDDDPEMIANAEFIAHARTDVPALVAALRGVKKLLAEYEKDDQDHLRNFGQHHPYAGWAADHLRVALGEAQP